MAVQRAQRERADADGRDDEPEAALGPRGSRSARGERCLWRGSGGCDNWLGCRHDVCSVAERPPVARGPEVWSVDPFAGMNFGPMGERLSIVVPVYNEAPVIADVVAELTREVADG